MSNKRKIKSYQNLRTETIGSFPINFVTMVSNYLKSPVIVVLRSNLMVLALLLTLSNLQAQEKNKYGGKNGEQRPVDKKAKYETAFPDTSPKSGNRPKAPLKSEPIKLPNLDVNYIKDYKYKEVVYDSTHDVFFIQKTTSTDENHIVNSIAYHSLSQEQKDEIDSIIAAEPDLSNPESGYYAVVRTYNLDGAEVNPYLNLRPFHAYTYNGNAKFPCFNIDTAYWWDGSQFIYPSNDQASDLASLCDSVPMAASIADIGLVGNKLSWAVYQDAAESGLFPSYKLAHKITTDNGTAIWEYHVPIVHDDNNKFAPLLWIWLLILAAFATTAVLLYLNTKKIIREAIANKKEKKKLEDALDLVDDSPLAGKEQDQLQRSPLCNSLKEIITNPQRPRPMSIALDGSWGIGKTSVMKMLQRELEEDGNFDCQTIWFNAWHQEDQASIVNAFLLNLLKKLNEKITKDNNIVRLRLLQIRFHELNLFKAFLLGLGFWSIIALLFLLGLFLYQYFPESNVNQLIVKNNRILYKISCMARMLMFGDKDAGNIIALVISVGLPALGGLYLKKEADTSGVFDLMDIVKLSVSKEELDINTSDPGFRESFKRRFWQLMYALRDKRLEIIVFIDDLDRVDGKKIFQQLEAINLISDSASRPYEYSKGKHFAPNNLVFILGMDFNTVCNSLGKYLQEIYKTEDENLGRNYMEKLIQMKIPLVFDESKMEDLTGKGRRKDLNEPIQPSPTASKDKSVRIGNNSPSQNPKA